MGLNIAEPKGFQRLSGFPWGRELFQVGRESIRVEHGTGVIQICVRMSKTVTMVKPNKGSSQEKRFSCIQ